jgi:uncharacterized membrane protein
VIFPEDIKQRNREHLEEIDVVERVQKYKKTKENTKDRERVREQSSSGMWKLQSLTICLRLFLIFIKMWCQEVVFWMRTENNSRKSSQIM